MKIATLATLCLLIFAASSGVVISQEIPSVRAGEHPTYSRIVIPVPAGTQWEFTASERRAQLLVPGANEGFDLSAVFDRIPRTRIRDVSTETSGDGTRITFSMACDCRAEASISGRYVLVDVIDQGARGTARLESDVLDEKLEEMDSVTPPTRRPATPAQLAEPAEPNPGVPETAGLPSSSDETPQENERAANELDDTRAEEVADLLIEQLQRAANEGLVEIAPDEDLAQPENPTPEVQTETPGQSALEPFEETVDGMEDLAKRLERAVSEIEQGDIGDAIRLQVPREETAIAAVPLPADGIEEDVAGRPEHCLDDYFYDFSVLDPAQKPVDQVIELRARLLGEFDTPDATAAVELARLYVSLGLGVEAQAVAAAFIDDELQREFLMELAEVVEGRDVPIGSKLDKAAGCPGPAAVWRTAGFSETETQPLPDTDAVISNLAGLPVELRRRIVPRIVASFIRRDQVTAAEASFAILDRAPGEHGPEHDFQRAALLRESGQNELAEAILAELSRRSDPIGPSSLVALVDSMVDRGAKVPDKIVEELSDLAHQFRGTKLGNQLRHGEIKGKAGNGLFGEALGVIRSEIGERPARANDYLAVAESLLMNQSAENTAAGEYATAIFESMALVSNEAISAEARLAVANQMLDLGLPGIALELASGEVKPMPTGAETNDAIVMQAREIVARAHLEIDQPQRTLDALTGNPSAAESAIRISALTKLGRHQAALAEADLVDAEMDTASIGFRAGSWDRVANEETLHGALARYMLRREGADEETMPAIADPDLLAIEKPAEQAEDISLKTAESIRSQSESIRRVMEAALAEQ